MRLKHLFFILSRLFKPDKSLHGDIATDFRNLGILSIGGGMAGFLLQTQWTALLLFTVGCIIWGVGLYLTSRAKANDTSK